MQAAIEAEAGSGTNRIVDSVFIGLLPAGTTEATLDPGGERNLGFGIRQLGFPGTPVGAPGGATASPEVFDLEVKWSLVGFNGRNRRRDARLAAATDDDIVSSAVWRD